MRCWRLPMRRLAASLSLLAVAPVVAPVIASADSPKPVSSGAAAVSVNAFTADLVRQVAAEGGNLFVSPHSIAMALAMVRAGANGETAKQIDATFHLPPNAGTAFRELTATLAAVPTLLDSGGNGRPTIPAYEA